MSLSLCVCVSSSFAGSHHASPLQSLRYRTFFFPWISREINPSSQPFIRVIMNTTGRNNQYKIRLTTANTTYRGKNSYWVKITCRIKPWRNVDIQICLGTVRFGGSNGHKMKLTKADVIIVKIWPGQKPESESNFPVKFKQEKNRCQWR